MADYQNDHAFRDVSDRVRGLERRVSELEARLIGEARTLGEEAKSVAGEARILAEEARTLAELRRAEGEELARRLREQDQFNQELRARLSLVEGRQTSA